MAFVVSNSETRKVIIHLDAISIYFDRKITSICRKGLLNLIIYCIHDRFLLNKVFDVLSDLVKIKNLWQDANTKYNTGVTTN